MKRIATIQDLSCVGRCSLTVALPIISAAGIECCGIPTAVLSNHTGFPEFYKHDLTEDLPKISDRLKSLGITFDAIYTGYIANVSQMELIEGFIEEFRRKNAPVFVDPVMGDGGGLYSQITDGYAERMRRLCAKADVITPNLTEAAFLLEEDYSENPSGGDVRKMLKKLHSLGTGAVVITGIPREETNEIGFTAYDGAEFYEYFSEKRDLVCMGTGDIFASAMLAAMVREKGFKRSLEIAAEFTAEAVAKTADDNERRFYGVNFEQALPKLTALLEID